MPTNQPPGEVPERIWIVRHRKQKSDAWTRTVFTQEDNARGFAGCMRDERDEEAIVEPFARCVFPAPSPDKIPATALYWLKAARDESHTMAERLFYLENAYNHVVNALPAPSQLPTDIALVGICDAVASDLRASAERLNDPDLHEQANGAEACAEAVRASVSPADNWQPISSAPKNGKIILGFCDSRICW